MLDVEPHERLRWVTSAEGKGLDLVLEIHVAGDRRKDFETNVKRYARLGIFEHFLFDRLADRLHGYRLPAGASSNQPIVPQAGRHHSQALGLDLTVERGLVRFYDATAALPYLGPPASDLTEVLSDSSRERSRRGAVAGGAQLPLERDRCRRR